MPKMKIIPLAADSLGTRSMATYIETADVKILIDPSVALAKNRNGYEPHPVEKKLEKQEWQKIVKHAKQAHVLIVTHYHYDHHKPGKTEIYKGKTVFIKDPKKKINKSQAARAKFFLSELGEQPKSIQVADGQEFKFGKTRLKFSAAVPHGDTERLGCVVQTLIDDGKQKFLHTSDILGANLKEQLDFIVKNDPDICYIDGPLTHMYGMPVTGLVNIVKKTKRLKALIVDHHFLRDLKWRDKAQKVFTAAHKRKLKVVCVAEFLGQKINQLEPIRKQLFAAA